MDLVLSNTQCIVVEKTTRGDSSVKLFYVFCTTNTWMRWPRIRSYATRSCFMPVLRLNNDMQVLSNYLSGMLGY